MWHLPNDAQLQLTDPDHARKTYLQLFCSSNSFLATPERLSAGRRGTEHGLCGVRHVAVNNSMPLSLRTCLEAAPSSDVDHHTRAQLTLSINPGYRILQPWRRNHPSPSHLSSSIHRERFVARRSPMTCQCCNVDSMQAGS